MNKQIYSENSSRRAALTIFGLVALIILGLFLFCPSVFADDAQDTAKTMIGSVVRVITTLCTVVGIILGIVGFVKFIIAHANEQGPDQQKAIMWIAVAIILVIVPNVISAIALNDNNGWWKLVETEVTT